MSELNKDAPANPSREEIMSALFAHTVMQQVNMALMFLGKAPNPETGQLMQDLETAKIFIDQLEMLEFKTKGNLNKQEESFLKQSLTNLRMAFVEAIESPKQSSPAYSSRPQPEAAASGAAPSPGPATAPDQASPAVEEAESRKKFTKKY